MVANNVMGLPIVLIKNENRMQGMWGKCLLLTR